MLCLWVGQANISQCGEATELLCKLHWVFCTCEAVPMVVRPGQMRSKPGYLTLCLCLSQ